MTAKYNHNGIIINKQAVIDACEGKWERAIAGASTAAVDLRTKIRTKPFNIHQLVGAPDVTQDGWEYRLHYHKGMRGTVIVTRMPATTPFLDLVAEARDAGDALYAFTAVNALYERKNRAWERLEIADSGMPLSYW